MKAKTLLVVGVLVAVAAIMLSVTWLDSRREQGPLPPSVARLVKVLDHEGVRFEFRANTWLEGHGRTFRDIPAGDFTEAERGELRRVILRALPKELPAEEAHIADLPMGWLHASASDQEVILPIFTEEFSLSDTDCYNSMFRVRCPKLVRMILRPAAAD